MIKMHKKYTFEGEEGTVLTVTRNHKAYPVVWIGIEGSIRTFTSVGWCSGGLPGAQLIEAKPTQWMNIYPCHSGPIHYSKEQADDNASPGRIACIEFTEGDGI